MPTLQWIGKEKVINHHREVPFRMLDKKYSFGEENSGNKIIHGDNLEALKALLPEYEGKIKCIYIDPPYNTGNEGWVYNDNVNDPRIRKWLGQVVGSEADDLTRHDKWLCMMYPRLRLLQKLLAEDGAIFISIDYNEQANLKLICDEIFGTSNFVADIPRVTKKGGKDHSDNIAKNHDVILIYTKSKECKFKGFAPDETGFDNEDEYVAQRGKYKLNQTLDYDSLWYNPAMDFPIEVNGKTFYAGGDLDKHKERHEGKHDAKDWVWRWSQAKFDFGYQNGFIVIKQGKRPRIYTKTYLNASIEKDKNGQYYIEYKDRTSKLSSLEFTANEYSNDNAKKEIAAIIGGNTFDFPKPSILISRLIDLVQNADIVLDSFAGSGTTAHAVLNLNQQDGGKRKFILCEMCDYAETITAERVRRVMNGYGEGKNAVEGTGGGFDYYELGTPVFDELTGSINKNLDIEQLKQYIWYVETASEYCPQQEKYYLGEKDKVGYYFIYDKILDKEALVEAIKTKAEQYIIYAEACLLSEEFRNQNNIVFKQIPQDIKRV